MNVWTVAQLVSDLMIGWKEKVSLEICCFQLPRRHRCSLLMLLNYYVWFAITASKSNRHEKKWRSSFCDICCLEIVFTRELDQVVARDFSSIFGCSFFAWLCSSRGIGFSIIDISVASLKYIVCAAGEETPVFVTICCNHCLFRIHNIQYLTDVLPEL